MQNYVDQAVAVDTDGPLAYVGTLTEVSEGYLRLVDAVVFDRHEARVPFEKFLIECADYGVSPSRRELMVRLERVLAVTRLSDIVVP